MFNLFAHVLQALVLVGKMRAIVDRKVVRIRVGIGARVWVRVICLGRGNN